MTEGIFLLMGKYINLLDVFFTASIEGWNNFKKKTSNWVLCKLSNSKYPFGTKHLGFEFDTTSLNSLIDFTLYLLDQNGKEISFSADKQKTPALNFSIQIYHNVKSKKNS